MSHSPLTIVVLAAGEGTRMRSRTLPKVLHGFAGRSLLGHVLAATAPLAAGRTVVVVGHGREQVRAHLAETSPEAMAVVQEQQLGTGHAVRIALEAAEDAVPAHGAGVVLVVPGDAPLLDTACLAGLLDAHRAEGAAVTLLTSILDDPTGYGRVLRTPEGDVQRVVEHADASAAEREVHEVATSVYAFDESLLRAAIARIGTANAQGEQYLPDVVGVLGGDGHRIAALTVDSTLTAGVNDRVQLAEAHRLYNARLLREHMRAGVSVIDPATTWVDVGVTLSPDVALLPATDLHGSTRVGEGATVGPQVSLTDTTVGAGAHVQRAVAVGAEIGAQATVGPYAYLRPGTRLAEGVHVGTYVEVKNSEIGTGTKVPHLSYVGDATIGEHTNIGAATVFVNYDGVAKHRSVVGSHARTGADNMFVAPVSVGDGAYTAAGSVITEDVPPGALGVARATQRNVAGWVERRRPGTASDEAAARALAAEKPKDDDS